LVSSEPIIISAILWGIAALAPLLDATAAEVPPAVSRVRSSDGRTVSFFPISTPRAIIEGPYWSHSTDCVIAFPDNYAETGDVLDTFELPTEEGIPVIIEHKWSWGKPSGLSVKVPKDGRAFPKGVQTVECTLKTACGPPVFVSLQVRDGRIVDRRFQIAEPTVGSPQCRTAPHSLDLPQTARDLVEELASSPPQSALLAIERRLFLRDVESASNLVSRLADSNPRLRESAAAFARWLPGSVTPAALAERIQDVDPRVAREARYSLNVLLLREGKEVEDAAARELIPHMLRLFIQELCRNPNYDWAATNFRPRRGFLQAAEIAVLAHNIPPMPQLDVDTTALELNSIQSFQPRARIRFSFPSHGQFADRIKDAWMPVVHFHMIRARDSFARVALSGMAERDRHWEMNWVALFQKTDTGWSLLAFPPYNEKYYLGRNYSNINPLALRDFGALSPSDVERFMFGIERIRTIDVRKSPLAEADNFDFRWAAQTAVLPSKYEPWLTRHLADANQAVSASVHLSLGRMGREDVVQGVVDLCADTPSQDLRRRAVAVLRHLLVPKIEKEGEEASHVVLSHLLTGADAYLAREERAKHPDVQKAAARATVLDSHAVLELRWEHQGVTLLCRRHDGRWQTVGALGGWIE